MSIDLAKNFLGATITPKYYQDFFSGFGPATALIVK